MLFSDFTRSHVWAQYHFTLAFVSTITWNYFGLTSPELFYVTGCIDALVNLRFQERAFGDRLYWFTNNSNYIKWVWCVDLRSCYIWVMMHFTSIDLPVGLNADNSVHVTLSMEILLIFLPLPGFVLTIYWFTMFSPYLHKLQPVILPNHTPMMEHKSVLMAVDCKWWIFVKKTKVLRHREVVL